MKKGVSRARLLCLAMSLSVGACSESPQEEEGFGNLPAGTFRVEVQERIAGQPEGGVLQGEVFARAIFGLSMVVMGEGEAFAYVSRFPEGTGEAGFRVGRYTLGASAGLLAGYAVGPCSYSADSGTLVITHAHTARVTGHFEYRARKQELDFPDQPGRRGGEGCTSEIETVNVRGGFNASWLAVPDTLTMPIFPFAGGAGR